MIEALTIDAHGRVPAPQQTRVASFLISAYGAYARRLGATVAGPLRDAGALALHGEYFGTVEVVSLLTRSTTWSVDLALPLLAAQWELAWLPAPVTPPGPPLEDLAIDLAAFGHALLGGLRPVTLLPAGHSEDDPFALALHVLELESGRLLQAPMVLLRSAALAPRREAVDAAVAGRHAQVRALWAAALRYVGG